MREKEKDKRVLGRNRLPSCLVENLPLAFPLGEGRVAIQGGGVGCAPVIPPLLTRRMETLPSLFAALWDRESK